LKRLPTNSRRHKQYKTPSEKTAFFLAAFSDGFIWPKMVDSNRKACPAISGGVMMAAGGLALGLQCESAIIRLGLLLPKFAA